MWIMGPGPPWSTKIIVGLEQTGPAPSLASMQGRGPHPVLTLEGIHGYKKCQSSLGP